MPNQIHKEVSFGPTWVLYKLCWTASLFPFCHAAWCSLPFGANSFKRIINDNRLTAAAVKSQSGHHTPLSTCLALERSVCKKRAAPPHHPAGTALIVPLCFLTSREIQFSSAATGSEDKLKLFYFNLINATLLVQEALNVQWRFLSLKSWFWTLHKGEDVGGGATERPDGLFLMDWAVPTKHLCPGKTPLPLPSNESLETRGSARTERDVLL